jgi:hypothetical protein
MPEALPRYFGLSSEQVGELIADAHLRASNAQFYYIPDVHDLAYFCFPVSPSGKNVAPMADIADDQASLLEVFLRRKPKPLLISEYEQEFDRNFRSLQNGADEAYSTTEMLTEFLYHIDMPQAPDPDDARKSLERDFNLVLAVITGIYSIGLARWKEVERHLVLESNVPNGLEPEVVRALHQYKPTPLVKQIVSMLAERDIERSLGRPFTALKERAATNDARAVDKVIYLNGYMEQAYQQRKVSVRHIFLYFASAPKTKFIFGMPAVQRALPLVNDIPFSPWRDRSQVFLATALQPSTADEAESCVLLIDNLKKFQELTESAKRPRIDPPGYKRCSACVLANGDGSGCRWKELCAEITKRSRSYLRDDATILPNLGLLARVQKYSSFASRRSSLADAESLRKLFLELIEDEGNRDFTLERMWLVQQRLSLNSTLLQALPSDLDTEVITSPLQVLPLAVQVRDPEYRTIIKVLLDYVATPNVNVNRRQGLLTEIYDRFVSIDRVVERFSPEHELIRLIIYLAFEGANRSSRTLRQIDNAIRRLSIEGLDSEWGTDFAYVKSWALRLHGQFRDCRNYTKDAIERSADPRLYHAALLNLYAWYETGTSNLELVDVLRVGFETEKRYREYTQVLRDSLALPDLIEELLAVCINDIVYLCCFGDPPENLAIAREYIELLKDRVSESAWMSRYPEYVHTHATLLMREAQVSGSAQTLDEAEALAHLASSQRGTAVFKRLERDISKIRGVWSMGKS